MHSAKTDETSIGGFGTIRMACFPVLKIPITPDEPDEVDGVRGLGKVVGDGFVEGVGCVSSSR